MKMTFNLLQIRELPSNIAITPLLMLMAFIYGNMMVTTTVAFTLAAMNLIMMARGGGGAFGFSIETLIMAIVGVLIAALIAANMLPTLVSPIFGDTNSLYAAYLDIWNHTLKHLIGASSASTVSPYVAIGALVAIAVILTYGFVNWIKGIIGW
jgi:hypothetical protein